MPGGKTATIPTRPAPQLRQTHHLGLTAGKMRAQLLANETAGLHIETAAEIPQPQCTIRHRNTRACLMAEVARHEQQSSLPVVITQGFP